MIRCMELRSAKRGAAEYILSFSSDPNSNANVAPNLLQIYEVIIYILQNYERVVTVVWRHSNTLTRLLSRYKLSY